MSGFQTKSDYCVRGFTLINSIETFVSNVPEAALCTEFVIFGFSEKADRSLLLSSQTRSERQLLECHDFDEAILRCRLIAAPLNKGAIIMELQSFRLRFGNNFSMSPDKLVNVWSQLMSWLKDYEKYYYLCTFYDYSKNVYGLDVSQQPPNGNFGLIAVMYTNIFLLLCLPTSEETSSTIEIMVILDTNSLRLLIHKKRSFPQEWVQHWFSTQ